jgi:adenylate cyclase
MITQDFRLSQPLEHKLAVILHTDVVGSTRLVHINEVLAHQRIVEAFKCFAVTIEKFNGVVHEIRGDALLAVFSRASDAVGAALAFQQDHTVKIGGIEDDVRPELRVGISMGEVIIADDTLTGAGVVLAQRLEQLSDAGGVVIQGAVYETLPKSLPLDFDNLGEQLLKGFNEPVRAYRVSSQAKSNKLLSEKSQKQVSPTPTSTEKPSIAVLPFANLSDDPEQEFFSDGISEDIIAELSRFHSLFVIARNSSFQYKGGNVSIQKVGRELGVQYIVEGSVRRAGNRIRVLAQLIEVETENQIWGERYDREMIDIFEVQDDVTRSIVAVLPGRVQEDVVDRAARKPTENMKAYELMLQGKAFRDLLSAEGNAAARLCCQKAIELDQRYARAYMYLSDSYIVDVWLGLADPDAPDLAMKHARNAVLLDGNDMYIQDHLGFAHLCCGLWREAEVQFDKTLAKIVNEAESMAWCGYAYLLMGNLTRARTVVLEAMRLDPLHPPAIDWILGQIFYYEEKYDEVVDIMYGKALLNSLAYAFVAAAHAHLGHHESMQIALQAFITERRQEFSSRGIEVKEDTLETLAGAYRVMWCDPASWSRLADGLRLAGLPD